MRYLIQSPGSTRQNWGFLVPPNINHERYWSDRTIQNSCKSSNAGLKARIYEPIGSVARETCCFSKRRDRPLQNARKNRRGGDVNRCVSLITSSDEALPIFSAPKICLLGVHEKNDKSVDISSSDCFSRGVRRISSSSPQISICSYCSSMD